MAATATELLDRFQDPAHVNLFFRSQLAPRGLTTLNVEIVRVQLRPRAGISGLYKVTGVVGEHPFEHFYGVTNEELKHRETRGLLRTTFATSKVWVWRHPQDPRLPGLQLATDLGSLTAMWPQLFNGVPSVSLEMKTYRPLRRAVIKASSADKNWGLYFKVLTRKRVERLAKVHRIMEQSPVPTAKMLQQPMAGIVALEQLHGKPLTEYLFRHPSEQILDGLTGTFWTDMLQGLPEELTQLPKRSSWTDGLHSYAKAAATALPNKAERIRNLHRHIKKELPKADPGPVVATHGDFYEANVYLTHDADTGYALSGLLDLDTMGPGHMVDDLACMLGHLAILPTVHPGYASTQQIRRAWEKDFEQVVNSRALQLRTAAVALSLVAGTRATKRQGWYETACRRLDTVEEILSAKKT